MKITKPEDKQSSDETKLNEAVEKFEKELYKDDNGQEYYHLVIIGEYSRNVCDIIERSYLLAGWKKAVCKTSSENGERGGLTGLQLWS